MKRWTITLALVTVFFVAGSTAAQNQPQLPQGGFPDAIFFGHFTKFIPTDNPYHPFDAWNAGIGLDATLFRKDASAVSFNVYIDSVGQEKRTSRIGVDGTGYRFGLAYRYEFVDNKLVVFVLTFGFEHLSAHVTEDLLTKVAEEIRKRHLIPPFRPVDLNVFFLEGQKCFDRLPLQPEIRLHIQPIGFRFRGGHYNYEQPVYLDLQATPWRGHEKRIVVESQHEFGKDSYNLYSARLELYAKNQKEGRLQIGFSYAPGQNLHISPNQGWLRDGPAVFVKFYFHAK